MAKKYQTPGVYIAEKNAFPNSAVPVATAVPAFIGYTEKATQNQKDLHQVPTRIASLAEYQLYFGAGPQTLYKLSSAADPNAIYTLETVQSTRYLLFYSLKLFFANGGTDCYIVSIGDYHSKHALSDFDDETSVGSKVALKGIKTLLHEPEPTLLVIPDAVLLGAADCAKLQQSMLAHCQQMASRFAILDVFMDENAAISPDNQAVVADFRSRIGDDNLQWGAAYYPWLYTNITGAEGIDFHNIEPGSISTLKTLLQSEVEASVKAGLAPERALDINKAINKIQAKTALASATGADLATSADATLHQTLLTISPLYKAIMNSLREKLNLLPPSAGIAGIYCMVDNTIGVFQSPANVSVGSVIQPAVSITHDEQEDLNVPLDGKAVNAIRTFPGKGVLVWGARTLDGNSQDWRYINVRRTVIFIEQSIKYAMEPYVFEPNTSSTWTTVQAMIANFLTNVWQSGALAGAAPADAFSVKVGLGTTMTPLDILDGIMRVTVKIAVTRPAEFIVITFQQKMQQS